MVFWLNIWIMTTMVDNQLAIQSIHWSNSELFANDCVFRLAGRSLPPLATIDTTCFAQAQLLSLRYREFTRSIENTTKTYSGY